MLNVAHILGRKKLITNLNKQIQSCTDCDLCYLDVNKFDLNHGKGKLTMFGTGKILFLGQNPSTQRFFKCSTPCDAGICKQFIYTISNMGLDIEKVSLTNIVKCSTPDNRPPNIDEQNACKKWLNLEIELLQPTVIISLGRIATNVAKGLGFTGKMYDIWHPSFIQRYPKHKIEYRSKIEKILEEIK